MRNIFIAVAVLFVLGVLGAWLLTPWLGLFFGLAIVGVLAYNFLDDLMGVLIR